MLPILKNRIEETLKTEIKNNVLGQALKQIDKILAHVEQDHKETSIENLAPKLVELAEKFAENMSSNQMKFSKDLYATVKKEVGSCEHIEVAA